MFTGSALGERGEVFQALRARDHVDDARLLDRLSRVAGFELGERIVALAKERCSAAQDPGTLGPGQRRPGGLRLARRVDCCLDLGGTGDGNVAEALAGCGIDGDQAVVRHGQLSSREPAACSASVPVLCRCTNQ